MSVQMFKNVFKSQISTKKRILEHWN